MLARSDLEACVTAGLLSHWLVLSVGEWHLRATRLLIFYVFSSFALIILLSQFGDLLWKEITTRASLDFAIYLSSLWGSVIVYRVVFNPLRAFPGPVGARVSKLWHMLQCRTSKNHLWLEQLHLQYGSFIRTGQDVSLRR